MAEAIARNGPRAARLGDCKSHAAKGRRLSRAAVISLKSAENRSFQSHVAEEIWVLAGGNSPLHCNRLEV